MGADDGKDRGRRPKIELRAAVMHTTEPTPRRGDAHRPTAIIAITCRGDRSAPRATIGSSPAALCSLNWWEWSRARQASRVLL